MVLAVLEPTDNLYRALVLLHILAVIVGFGSTFVYPLLGNYASKHPGLEGKGISNANLEAGDIQMVDPRAFEVGRNLALTEGAVVRREPLLWVASAQHEVADQEILPLALSKPPCMWRDEAISALTGVGRRYRVLYQSVNATAISAAVLPRSWRPSKRNGS